VLVLTLNVVLFVVSVAEESVPVSVFEYSGLLTSEPADGRPDPAAASSPSVEQVMDSPARTCLA
jgi:hypothetical protein